MEILRFIQVIYFFRQLARGVAWLIAQLVRLSSSRAVAQAAQPAVGVVAASGRLPSSRAKQSPAPNILAQKRAARPGGESEVNMTLKCPQCGAEMEDGFKFCDRCGHRLVEQAQAPAQVSETVFSSPQSLEPSEPAADLPTLAIKSVAQSPGIQELTDFVPDQETEMSVGPLPGDEDTLLAFLMQQSPQIEAAVIPPSQSWMPFQETQMALPMSAIKCPQCGQLVEDEGLYCGQCGALLDRSQAKARPSEHNMQVAYAPTPHPQRGAAPAFEEQGLALSGHRAALVVAYSGARLDLPDQVEMTVGRCDPANNVYPQIDLDPYGAEDAGMSRWHAKIVRQGEQYTLIDTESSNGSWLNGTLLIPNQPYPLQSGDEIRFGQLSLHFVLD